MRRALWCMLLTRVAFAISITEIHYHPPLADGDCEFLELYNESATVVDMSRFRLSHGIDFVFPEGTHLAPGEYVVVAANAADFRSRYGFDPDGVYTGRLDNSGDHIVLEDDSWAVNAAGEEIAPGCPLIELRYNDRDEWPAAADGPGHSLCITDPFLDPDDAASWVPSPSFGGTPGRANGLGGSSSDVDLVARGATWRYFKGTQAPPAGWRDRAFSDGGWTSGRLPIGYADGDDNTLLADMEGNYTTVFARKTFSVADPAAVQELTLSAWYDDGFVAYLNGTRIAGDGFTGDPVHTSVSSVNHEASSWEPFPVTGFKDRLVAGNNVLAVVGLNASMDSSDFSLDASLAARLRSGTSAGASAIVVNECLYVGAGTRFVELYNRSDQPVDLAGYYLTNDTDRLDLFAVPGGTVVPGRGFVSFTEAQLGFALEVVENPPETPLLHIVLLDPARSRVVAARSFDPDLSGPHSRARVPDGSEAWFECPRPTPGAPNAVTVSGDLVINEIMYHPPVDGDPYDPSDGDPDDLEYVELYHRGTSSIDLSGFHFTKGIDFAFPDGAIASPGSYLVIARNPLRFREVYGELPNVYGPYVGKLSNEGEMLRIKDAAGNTLDEVRYYDGGRWSPWADGDGSSLELIDPRQDNSLATAWDASTNDGAWTEVTYQGTHKSVIDGSTGESEFQMCLLGAGEVLVDSIFLGKSLTATNEISNGTFDSGTTGWTIQGTHRDSVRITGDTYEGQGALRLLATGRGDSRCNRIECDTRTLTGGATYYVRYGAKWVRGMNRVLSRTHRHGVVKAVVIPLPDRLGTPGASNSAAEDNQGPVMDCLTQSPALPGASDSVQFTIRVQDADGVGSVVMRHRSDGGSLFASATLYDDGSHQDGDRGDGVYGGVVPPYADGTKVEFYIEATDAAPAARTGYFPREGRAKPYVYLVRTTKPQSARATYHVVMSAPNYSGLYNSRTRGESMSNYLWPGSFIFESQRIYHGVGMRFRGSPWIRPGNPEAGFRIRFNRDALLNGLVYEMNLDRNDNDGTRQKNRTAQYLLRRLGAPHPGVKVPFSTSEYVDFTVNTTSEGGYEHIQKIDGDYLEYWWPGDDSGNLFKVDDWFEAFADNDRPDKILTANLVYRGDDKEPYRWFFGLRTNERNDDYSPLTELCRNLTRFAGQDLDDYARSAMDVPEWAAVLAVRFFIGDWDTLGYNRGKNAFLYFAPAGRAKLCPWDSDLTFEAGHASDKMYPEAGGGDAYFPNMAKLFQRPWARRLMDQGYAFLTGPDGPANRANLDWLLNATQSQAGLGSPDEIKGFLTTRSTFVRARISAQSFAITGPNGGADFTAPSSPVQLTGTAPADVDFFEVDGADATDAVTWTSVSAWQLRLALAPGSKTYTVRALSRSGRLIGSDSIAISLAGTRGPRIRRFAPTTGPESGATKVVIEGENFQQPLAVLFGGREASVVQSAADRIEAVVPQGSGFATVTVRNGTGGEDTAPERYWYVPAPLPVIAGFSPIHGPAAGGTPVTVWGTAFKPGCAVFFGTQIAGETNYISKYQVTALTPPLAGGSTQVRVKLVNPDGRAYAPTSPTFGYDPGPSPVISGPLEPPNGSSLGGDLVRIRGSNFLEGLAVYFGDTTATVVQVTPTAIDVRTPGGPVGWVAVEVRNPDNGTVRQESAFRYDAPIPIRLNSVEPDSGSLGGGTEVVISGAGFSQDPARVTVLFGMELATVVEALSTELTVITPPQSSEGPVTVTVFNPDNSSASLPDAFTYILPVPPTIVEVVPDQGPPAGGNVVTVRGANFWPDPDRLVVIFETQQAVVTVATPTEIEVIVPAGSGTVLVSVSNPDNTSAILPGAYTYTDEIGFVRGDANRDAQINIADTVKILDYLFRAGKITCLDAADANDSGGIDIADAIRVLGTLFARQGDLPMPYPDAGVDPTPDGLGCVN